METAIAGPGGPVRPIPRLSLGFIFFLLFLFGPFGLFFLCWLLQDEKWISIHQRTRQDHRSRRLHDRIFIHKIKVDQQIEAK